METDVILEPDVSPRQMAELAIEAEKLGIRAIWSSNDHQDLDCFLALAPAVAATSKIILGALAVSPWELHPLKMANSILSLNEMSNGRAMIAISGGGGVLGATGWKISKDGPVWPIKDEANGQRYPERRVRGVQECIEVLDIARSGKLAYSYDGEIFQVTRPFQIKYAKAETGPLIYGCCSGPMMIRMGARLADGISDDIVNKLIAGMSSAGDLDSLDAEIERYKGFRDSGLTELSLRLFDEPMAGLKLLGERVLPALR